MVSNCGAALLGAGTDLDGSVFVAVLRFWVGVIGRKEFVCMYVCVWASGGKAFMLVYNSIAIKFPRYYAYSR
jgi:hypothetical protein